MDVREKIPKVKLTDCNETIVRLNKMITFQEQRISELEKQLSQDVSTREQHWSTQAELYRLRNVELEKEVERKALVEKYPCGHWVDSVMSFCPICSKLSSSIPKTALLTEEEIRDALLSKDISNISKTKMLFVRKKDLLFLAKALVQAQQAKINGVK